MDPQTAHSEEYNEEPEGGCLPVQLCALWESLCFLHEPEARISMGLKHIGQN